MNERVISQVQVAEIVFLRRVRLSDTALACEIRKALNIKHFSQRRNFSYDGSAR